MTSVDHRPDQRQATSPKGDRESLTLRSPDHSALHLAFAGPQRSLIRSSDEQASCQWTALHRADCSADCVRPGLAVRCWQIAHQPRCCFASLCFHLLLRPSSEMSGAPIAQSFCLPRAAAAPMSTWQGPTLVPLLHHRPFFSVCEARLSARCSPSPAPGTGCTASCLLQMHRHLCQSIIPMAASSCCRSAQSHMDSWRSAGRIALPSSIHPRSTATRGTELHTMGPHRQRSAAVRVKSGSRTFRTRTATTASQPTTAETPMASRYAHAHQQRHLRAGRSGGALPAVAALAWRRRRPRTLTHARWRWRRLRGGRGQRWPAALVCDFGLTQANTPP